MSNSKKLIKACLLLTVILCFGCQRDDRALVVGKIQQASDLVTSEFTIDKVVFGKKSRRLFFIPVNEATFLAYSQAKIKTGIDLSLLKEEDVEIEGLKITLNLPPVEVINFSYPPSSFREDSLISQPKRFLNSISIHDQEEFFRSAEMDIRENLAYMGLVKSSQTNTRKLLHTMLKTLGFEEIYIQFKNDSLRIRPVRLNETADPS